MLNENDIINYVCDHLEKHGFSISQKLTAKQRGDDIIATKGYGRIRQLHIEAKGETSSEQRSRRHGKPFNKSQVEVHVSRAFYQAVKMGIHNAAVGMAFPKNDDHRQCVDKVQHAIDKLGIIVFWVASDGKVTTSQPLD